MSRTNPDDSTEWVIHATRATFDRDVIERSRETAVVVDFWAPWCAPCRALGPVLEGLAEEYGGRFTLVKVNTDEVPDAAAAFQVQGIPAVFAMRHGKVVDSFTGALPEPQIRQWLDHLLLSEELEAARELESEQPAEAEQRYRAILQDFPKAAEAKIGLARTLLSQQKVDEAKQLVEELEARGFLEPEAETIKAALQFQEKSSTDLDALRQAVKERPDDVAAVLALAEGLAGQQQYQESLDLCLELVRKDRHGAGERARQLMIDIFRVLPEDSELISTYRRKLSMLLY